MLEFKHKTYVEATPIKNHKKDSSLSEFIKVCIVLNPTNSSKREASTLFSYPTLQNFS